MFGLLSSPGFSLQDNFELNEFNFIIGDYFFFMGQFLRVYAIKTLGDRWSTQILIIPNLKAINDGI